MTSLIGKRSRLLSFEEVRASDDKEIKRLPREYLSRQPSTPGILKRKLGLRLLASFDGDVLSSDSHNARHLENLKYGVWVARRGWVEAKDVLNTLPLPELLERLESSRTKMARPMQ
jgi:DNA polymerase (family 10)